MEGQIEALGETKATMTKMHRFKMAKDGSQVTVPAIQNAISSSGEQLQEIQCSISAAKTLVASRGANA
eukprot:2546709-Pyramimonas_sp.AAC.2